MLFLLRIIPKNLLSYLVGFFADQQISRYIIGPFAKYYKINLKEAEKSIHQYPSLNAFFTRRLKLGSRKIEGQENRNCVTSPVDGTLVQMGVIDKEKCVQAKGKDYTLTHLLESPEEAKWFDGGFYLTIYLAPVDYHRIHHYIDGAIGGYRYIPGTLFPVNNNSVEKISNLFCINERLITYMQSQGSRSALVKVGATIVGKIKVNYDTIESNIGDKGKAHFYDKPIHVRKGQELGVFQMGSTVILLFEKGLFKSNDIIVGTKLRFGQKIGHLGTKIS